MDLLFLFNHLCAGYTASLHSQANGYMPKKDFFQEQLDSNNGMGYSVLKINTDYEYTSAGQYICFRFSTELFCRESAVRSPTDVTLYNTKFVMKMSSPFLYAQVSDRTINPRLPRYIIIHLSLCSVPCIKYVCVWYSRTAKRQMKNCPPCSGHCNILRYL